MSDYNSSLPIRTETDGDVVVKIADATVPSQQLKVEADGSINVNADITATDLDIRDLSAAQDNVAISDGTDTLAINADGSINATVSATNLDIRDLAFATDKVDVSGSEVSLDATTLAALENITVSATDLDIRDLAFATDKVDVSGSSVTVSATDLDIRDLSHVSDSVKVGDGTDFLAVNTDGSINVVVQEDVGTEVVDYDTAAAVAAGASSNHDQVFASASKLYQVLASASGKMRIEVQIETGASTNVFNTIAVAFNSTASPNIDLTLSKYAAIPSGARVRIIRRNADNQAQDLYSTIIGILG